MLRLDGFLQPRAGGRDECDPVACHGSGELQGKLLVADGAFQEEGVLAQENLVHVDAVDSQVLKELADRVNRVIEDTARGGPRNGCADNEVDRAELNGRLVELDERIVGGDGRFDEKVRLERDDAFGVRMDDEEIGAGWGALVIRRGILGVWGKGSVRRGRNGRGDGGAAARRPG